MSGPNDVAGFMKSLGIGGAAGGPPQGFLPGQQTAKRLGGDRVPQGGGAPRRNPGQVQDAAARELGVPNYRLQPQERPTPQVPLPRPRPADLGVQEATPQPTIQAPPPPALPRTKNAPAETNPKTVPTGPIPLPRPKPFGLDMQSMLDVIRPQDVAKADDRPATDQNPQGAAVAQVLKDRVQQAETQPPPAAPPTGIQARREAKNAEIKAAREAAAKGASAEKMVADTIAGEKPQAKPGMSSVAAAPAPPQSAAIVPPPEDQWGKDAVPFQPDPRQLIPVITAAIKAKSEAAKPPVQDPASTRPSPTVTEPVPPGTTPPVPPGVKGNQDYTPSQPSFQGYEIIPPKAKKGEEGHKQKVGEKGNSLYYYTRIGVLPGDNSGVAQRIREIRAKASNPRTATKMTPEEDRILAQYADSATKKGDPSLLMSMEPEAISKRMELYKLGQGGSQIPDRYQERPPGVEEPENPNAPVPLKLPPKAQEKKLDKAEKLANDAIQNPKPKATDPDDIVVRQD